MQIFVAGGTGVVGRRVVPALLAEGHQVSVLTRSTQGTERVRVQGAMPVQVSLFDADRLTAAVAGHDAVVNLATSIPPFSKAVMPGAWKLNDRIRTTGSKNLVDAAIAAHATRYVQESVAFLYADGGPAWIHEEHPVDATSITASAVEAEAQAQRASDHGAVGVVLRFATFYGPDSGHTAAAVRLARMGLASMPGAPESYLSLLATDDAATAVVAAVTAADAGTYNVGDDDPLPRGQFDEVLARSVGRRRLRPMPRLLRHLTGDKLDHVVRSQRVSNQAFKSATGWTPTHRSAREVLPTVVAAIRRSPAGGSTRTRTERA